MTRNVVRRTLLVLASALVLLAVIIPTPADAAPGALVERDGDPVIVTLNGTILVGAQEVVDDIWVANGRVVVDGRVEGSVVVLRGGAVVRGSVGGDVVVVSGGVWVGPEAVVRGDVQGSEAVTVADGAVVEGSETQQSVMAGLGSILPRFRTILWIGVTVALLALGLAALRLSDDTVERARGHLVARPFGSAVRGLAALVLLPVLAVLAVATIVGGLLGLLLLAITALAAIAGLAVTATTIGRWLLRERSVPLAFLLGAVILQIAALIPVAGPSVLAVAAVLGTGALLQALRDARADDQAPTATTTAVAPQPADIAPATSGLNLDLRPGRPADPVSTPAGPAPSDPVLTPAPSWLSPIVSGATAGEPVVDLRGDTPTVAPAAPEILASLPVREDAFADDPEGAPGNGVRQSLFAEGRDPQSAQIATPPADESPETEPEAYRGPLFKVPDPARMPTAEPGGAPEADTLVHTPEADADLPTGGLFSSGARAWRPSSN